MPQCDVCLVECVDVGVLGCKHVVCRSCGMSQSICLVCARVGGKQRRRIGKQAMLARANNTVRVDEVLQRDISKETPSDTVTHATKSKLTASAPPPLIRASSSKQHRAAAAPKSPDAQIDPIRPVSVITRQITNTSPNSEEPSPEPPLKFARKEHFPVEDTKALRTVYGPTAFDEVRCELRALGSAPKLPRAALRTTGKLSVALLSRFIHKSLGLATSESVLLRCSGEELTDAMTLGQLVTHVWPKSEGHMILDYRVAREIPAQGPTAQT